MSALCLEDNKEGDLSNLSVTPAILPLEALPLASQVHHTYMHGRDPSEKLRNATL